MQNLPMLAIQPYLLQNIKRKKLLQFLNVRSLFSIYTVLPVFIFFPFVINVIHKKYGLMISLSFLITLFSFTLFNHFFVLFIKRKTILSARWLLGFFAIVVIFVAAEYFKIFSLRSLSANLFTQLLQWPWLCIGFVLLAVAAFYNNNRFLVKNFYLDDAPYSTAQKRIFNYTWLQNFGIIGEIISNDVKLILRNKRPRSLLILSFLFLLYGFLFYKKESFSTGRAGMLLVGSIFITGMFITNYGQFLFAWQSNHFDGLMSGRTDVRLYIKSKMILLKSFCTFAFLLCLFYGFMNVKIIPVLIAAWLFNIGINITITCFIGTLNYSALDISKSSSLNYQGMGLAQWLYSLIIICAACLIYFPFALLFNSWAGIAAIAFAGLINILLQNWWVDILSKQFIKKKYKMLEGFRNK